MQVRLLRDFLILGDWRLSGERIDVPDPLGRGLLMEDVAEREFVALETAMITRPVNAARTKKGKSRRRRG